MDFRLFFSNFGQNMGQKINAGAEISAYRKNIFFCQIKCNLRFEFQDFFSHLFWVKLYGCLFTQPFGSNFITFLWKFAHSVVSKNFCIGQLKINKCWKTIKCEKFDKNRCLFRSDGDTFFFHPFCSFSTQFPRLHSD